MTQADRFNIIQELAKDNGLSGRPMTEESHYDRSTGTLFIGSTVYHSEDMEAAKAFFTENKARAKAQNDAAATYYEIGEIAIDQLIQSSLGAGGRVVVKKEEKKK